MRIRRNWTRLDCLGSVWDDADVGDAWLCAVDIAIDVDDDDVDNGENSLMSNGQTRSFNRNDISTFYDTTQRRTHVDRYIGIEPP
jgi:hypothetical protein